MLGNAVAPIDHDFDQVGTGGGQCGPQSLSEVSHITDRMVTALRCRRRRDVDRRWGQQIIKFGIARDRPIFEYRAAAFSATTRIFGN